MNDALGLNQGKDSKRPIDQALHAIAQKGSGALLYMEPRRAETGREDLSSSEPKLDALAVPKMDFRDYGMSARDSGRPRNQEIETSFPRPQESRGSRRLWT